MATGRRGRFAKYLHLAGADAMGGRYLCDGECKAIQGRFHSYCEASPDNPGLAVAYRLIWKHRATNRLVRRPGARRDWAAACHVSLRPEPLESLPPTDGRMCGATLPLRVSAVAADVRRTGAARFAHK